MTWETWETVVTAEHVAAHLADPRLRIFDCRHELGRPEAGLEAWRRGHLPGAIHADMDRDLAVSATATSGRHPLPAPDAFAARLRSWGVDDDSLVVAYDDASGLWAARFWWMTSQWLRHPHVAVLDGGLRRWLALGLPVTADAPAPRPAGRFYGKLDADRAVDAAHVGMAARDPTRRVLDARAPERFRGEVEPIDRVGGHIPGARNHPASSVTNADGTYRSPARLREEFSTTLDGVAPEAAIAYCGSGVTACQLLVAMERAGLHGARLYPGSWSEWSSDPARPVARGSD